MISKLYYRPFAGIDPKPWQRQDSSGTEASYQNLFDFQNGYRFPVRVGRPVDFGDDFNPETSKRAAFRDKMIRLYRRDGLKVLRLRRSEAGEISPETNPEADPEKKAEVVPEKRWTHQEKQRY